MATETKMGLAIVVILVCAFGFLVYHKFDLKQQKLASIEGSAAPQKSTAGNFSDMDTDRRDTKSKDESENLDGTSFVPKIEDVEHTQFSFLDSDQVDTASPDTADHPVVADEPSLFDPPERRATGSDIAAAVETDDRLVAKNRSAPGFSDSFLSRTDDQSASKSPSRSNAKEDFSGTAIQTITSDESGDGVDEDPFADLKEYTPAEQPRGLFDDSAAATVAAGATDPPAAETFKAFENSEPQQASERVVVQENKGPVLTPAETVTPTVETQLTRTFESSQSKTSEEPQFSAFPSDDNETIATSSTAESNKQEVDSSLSSLTSPRMIIQEEPALTGTDVLTPELLQPVTPTDLSQRPDQTLLASNDTPPNTNPFAGDSLDGATGSTSPKFIESSDPDSDGLESPFAPIPGEERLTIESKESTETNQTANNLLTRPPTNAGSAFTNQASRPDTFVTDRIQNSVPAQRADSPILQVAGISDDCEICEVRPNDNYWAISKRVYGTARYFSALALYNKVRIPDPKKLRPGMKVLIPDPKQLEKKYPELFRDSKKTSRQATGFFVQKDGSPAYRIGERETLSEISQKHLGRASRWIQIYRLNQSILKDPNKLKPGLVLALPEDATNVHMAP